jgi:molybdopterin synthase sulfur carrier subunit
MSDGVKAVDIQAVNVREAVDMLEELYPGMKDRIVQGDKIRANLAVSVDGEVARMGLLEKLEKASEVHFVPAIGGGE